MTWLSHGNNGWHGNNKSYLRMGFGRLKTVDSDLGKFRVWLFYIPINWFPLIYSWKTWGNTMIISISVAAFLILLILFNVLCCSLIKRRLFSTVYFVVFYHLQDNSCIFLSSTFHLFYNSFLNKLLSDRLPSRKYYLTMLGLLINDIFWSRMT